jgi:hypothetical protein
MKSLILVFLLTIGTMNVSYSHPDGMVKPDKKFPIDMVVTASNGCKFHVVGWVDLGVTVTWNGPNITINSYDIEVTSPCGDFNFQGMIRPSNGNDDFDVSEEKLKELVLDIVNDELEGN